jgi:hypothetical protein
MKCGYFKDIRDLVYSFEDEGESRLCMMLFVLKVPCSASYNIQSILARRHIFIQIKQTSRCPFGSSFCLRNSKVGENMPLPAQPEHLYSIYILTCAGGDIRLDWTGPPVTWTK